MTAGVCLQRGSRAMPSWHFCRLCRIGCPLWVSPPGLSWGDRECVLRVTRVWAGTAELPVVPAASPPIAGALGCPAKWGSGGHCHSPWSPCWPSVHFTSGTAVPVSQHFCPKGMGRRSPEHLVHPMPAAAARPGPPAARSCSERLRRCWTPDTLFLCFPSNLQPKPPLPLGSLAKMLIAPRSLL